MNGLKMQMKSREACNN